MDGRRTGFPSAVGDGNRALNQGVDISAGGITAFVICVLSSLLSTRDLTELSLRKRSHGRSRVSITAVNGMSSIARDFVPQFVSLSLIIVALARVPG